MSRLQRHPEQVVHATADAAPHGAIDDSRALPISKVTCPQCLQEIGRELAEACVAAAAQAEIDAILTQRKKKLEQRLARKAARRIERRP